MNIEKVKNSMEQVIRRSYGYEFGFWPRAAASIVDNLICANHYLSR